jgi:pseudouridine-5'-phosphate glycosidase
LALPRPEVEAWLAAALAEARARGIGGRDETPFLLAELARRSGGRTVALNEALVLDNARLAARLAAVLAARRHRGS